MSSACNAETSNNDILDGNEVNFVLRLQNVLIMHAPTELWSSLKNISLKCAQETEGGVKMLCGITGVEVFSVIICSVEFDLTL